jgi:hypothetical protein
MRVEKPIPSTVFCIEWLLGGKYVWFLVSQEILTKKAGVSVLLGQETLTKTLLSRNTARF